MKLQQLTPVPAQIELASPEELCDYFEKSKWPAPSFMLNVVSNMAGEFVGASQSSRDISNELDYQALIGFRKASDGILTTARTARIEQYRRSRHAPLALASMSGDFSGIPAVEAANAGPVDSAVYLLVQRGLVRKTKKRFNQPWVKVINVGGGSAFRMSYALTRLGWRRIIVESGAEFASWLIQKSVIGSIALSITDADRTSPLDACKSALKNLGVVGASLDSCDLVDQTLFTRWSDFHGLQLP